MVPYYSNNYIILEIRGILQGTFNPFLFLYQITSGGYAGQKYEDSLADIC
jgi:hypothetical protein